MSHFTVIITGANIDAQLEPFNENAEVDPYWEDEARTPQEHWCYNVMLEDGTLTEGVTLEDYVKAFLERYPDEDAKFRIKDGVLQRESTYNPDSKWDWWVVGGRWSGYFPLKAGVDPTTVGASVGEPGVFDNAPEAGWYDSLRKGDIDWERMVREAVEKAGVSWVAWHAAVAGTPEGTPWSEFYRRFEAKEITIEEARDLYGAQPRVVALKAAQLNSWGDSLADYQVPLDEFLQTAREEAVTPFAVLHEGEWLEAGQMGWFGASSDTPDSRKEYRQRWAKVLESLSDDTVLTVVDCHI